MTSEPCTLVCASPDAAGDLLSTIDGLVAALRTGATPVAPIREARKEADATGAMLPGGARVVHRVAGLSKTTAPLDPFRRGRDRARKADAVQRGEEVHVVRREILHVDASGLETSIVVCSPRGFALQPDHLDPVWRMVLQLGLVRDAVAACSVTPSHPAPSQAADAVACLVLDALVGEPTRGAWVSCVMGSPLGPALVRMHGVQPQDLDGSLAREPEKDDWPHVMELRHRRIDGARHWTLVQAVGETRLRDLDPMARMRTMRQGMPRRDDFNTDGTPIR